MVKKVDKILEKVLIEIDEEESRSWCEEEWAEIDIGDKRLNERVKEVATKMSSQPTVPLNQACEDWAETKGAYRLFNNEKVTSEKIRKPHQEKTKERMRSYERVLVPQDTSLLDFSSHKKTEGLGPIGTKEQDIKGLVMHSALAMTEQGMPLGVLSQKIWARSEVEEEMTKAQKQKRPIEEKESYKWLVALRETAKYSPEGVETISICDAEADIYDLFVEADKLNIGLLVRASQNRLLMDEKDLKLWKQVEQEEISGYLTIKVPARKGEAARQAKVSVRFKQTVQPKPPPHLKDSPIQLSAILVQEVDPPLDVTPIEWRLLSNVTVTSYADALERINWYCKRWQIEVYHKVLKSGCTVEDCRLQTADRLMPYLALSSIIAWRLFWMTHLNRQFPDIPCTAFLTEHEWRALYASIHKTILPPKTVPSVRDAVRWIAQLGGFLARKGDAQPGPTVLWRGWHRLHDISNTWLLFQRSLSKMVYI